MLENVLAGFSTVLQWPNIVIAVTAVVIGFCFGVIPGLGGAVALGLLIPVTFGMEAETAIILLIGVAGAVGFGGMITSIVLNTPGTPENAATLMDGYPLAKQGRAGEAMGAGVGASVLGGLIGIVVLVLLVPVARELVLKFSYPEYLMMAVFALTVIAVVTQGRAWRGLVAAGVGFMLSFIGLGPITGSPRFTFGETYLWDGINVVPALMGLFAGAEMLSLYGRGRPVAGETPTPSVSTFNTGVRAALRNWTLAARGGVIGTGVGVIPGVGGVVASFLSYGQAVRTSKHPETFGKGAVEGVIAAESANDAKDGGSMLPTVAFGIPGSVTSAMLLGALVLHGVPAGPTLMIERPDLIYIIISVLVVAKLVTPLLVRLVGPHAAKVTRVRPALLAPAVAAVALCGAYALNTEIYDVLIVLVFSYLGYGMQQYGFSRIAFVIALLLGALVERSYHQTIASFGDISGIVSRPISLVLVALTVLMLTVPAFQRLRRRRLHRESEEEGDDGPSTPQAPTSSPAPARGTGAVVFSLALLLIVGAIVWSAVVEVEGAARLVPLIIGVPTAASLAALVAIEVVRAGRADVADHEPVEPAGAGGSEPGRRDATSGDSTTTVRSSPTTAVRTDTANSRRMATFTLWVIGTVAVGWFLGMITAVPIAVFVLLKVVNREGWLLSTVMALALGLFNYAIFGVMLGVPL